MTDDQYEYHRRALAGEDMSAWPADVYCGWWRLRSGASVCVFDESWYGLQYSVNNGPCRDVDDFFREYTFGFAAKNPVSQDYYEEYTRTGCWPDVDQVCLQDFLHVDDAIIAHCEAAEAYVVLDPEDVEERRKAQTVLNSLHEWIRNAEDIIATGKRWKATLKAHGLRVGGKEPS